MKSVTGMEVRYRAHEIKEHLIRSKLIAETFRIRVMQPLSRSDHSERFQVVYTTDSDDFFDGYSTLARHLQLHGETPRFILVGIGYENARAAAVLRMRDLLTQRVRVLYQKEIAQLAQSGLVGGIEDLARVTRTTEAQQFLQFIREEMMPLIDAHYPTLPGENSYCGYSAGGTFGLYALFTQPDAFKRYVLGSPATSYNGCNFGIELAEAFIPSRRPIDAKVFLSVGELEEFKRGFGQFDLVSGYYRLAKYLKRAAIPGLDLTLRVFAGETHATAWSLAFSQGLKTLLGSVDPVPFWPDYLKS